VDPMTFLLMALAAALGAIVAWLAARARANREAGELNARLAEARTRVDEQARAHASRIKAYDEASQQVREAFGALASDALKQNNETFLHLAQAKLGELEQKATGDFDQRQRAIADLVRPISETLQRMDTSVKEADRQRIETNSRLFEQIANVERLGQGLQHETANLVNALKRSGVRGRWGELQLRRVVELAGMTNRCDFDEQRSLPGEEGTLRPDLIVRLPGGRNLVVDAKAPLDAYLKAHEAVDEAARLLLLQQHAVQVRTHVRQLGEKNYAARVSPSPEFVVMFLPGEMFFSAALEQDPTLIEYGVGRRVIPASPTTLIALLKAVAYGWQQDEVAREAKQIAGLGRELYDRILSVADHMRRVGSHLASGVRAYNETIASMESRMMVSARKLKDLSAGTAKDVADLEPIEITPREFQQTELKRLPFGEGFEEVEDGEILR
jgi:DNA recombination protein RmuC